MTILTPHRAVTPFDEIVRSTNKGMANWAISTSPFHCGECRFWSDATAAPPRHGFGTPAPQRCEMFTTLTGKRGPKVPHGAKACRYFETADSR
jgi:hypothetical protein